MESRIPGFPGEYLWELDMARMQLLALADAAPETLYGWRPVEGVRSFSAVMVHIAACQVGLLLLAGVDVPGGEVASIPEMIRNNMALERSLTAKQDVNDFLRRAFATVQTAFSASSADDLERPVEFFGEATTVRRMYLRILTHTHEHMGQAIAYARTFGMKMPWPDPLQESQAS